MRARREADGLADLPHARRVAAPAHLGVDELEDLALAGGEGCGLRSWRARRTHDQAFGANTRSEHSRLTLDGERLFVVGCDRTGVRSPERPLGPGTGARWTGPGVTVTPPWFDPPQPDAPASDRTRRRKHMAAVMITERPARSRGTGRDPSRRSGRASSPPPRPRGSGRRDPGRPATFRRRRLAPLVGLVAVVVMAAQAGAALGGSPLAAPERRPAVGHAATSSQPGDSLWSIAQRPRAGCRSPRRSSTRSPRPAAARRSMPGEVLRWQR